MTQSATPCCSGCGSEQRPCGCCEGSEVLTPEPTGNRPAQASLSYRVGTHASFLESMKARLSLPSTPDTTLRTLAAPADPRPLRSLTSRDTGDFSIALLDATAVVADILTFYQERIANEGYLRTATERRSVTELARLVGYQPRPGVSASTYLAYTIDENTTEEVRLARGAKAQTVPGPAEFPQTFETSEDLRARARWNRLRLRRARPQTLADATSARRLYLDGIATQLRPGDPLLVEEGGDRQVLRVLGVEARPEEKLTVVMVQPWMETTAELHALVSSAPTGETADAVKGLLGRLQQLLEHDPRDPAVRLFVEKEVLPVVRRPLATSQRMPKLRPWLERVASELSKLSDPGRAVPVGLNAISTGSGTGLAATLRDLVRKPSIPPANALRLRQRLERNLGSGADAGVQLIGNGASGLAKDLAVALAEYSGGSQPNGLRVHALRLRGGLYGRTLPKQATMVTTERRLENEVKTETLAATQEWPLDLDIEDPQRIDLEGAPDGITPGSLVMFDFRAVPRDVAELWEPRPGAWIAPLVLATKDVVPRVARADYGGTGDTTRLQFADAWLKEPVENPEGERNADFEVIRKTVVYARSEELTLALAPLAEPVCSGSKTGTEQPYLELDGLYEGLEAGRFLILAGERSDVVDVTGLRATEPIMISEVVHALSDAEGKPIVRSDDGESEPPPALPDERLHTFLRIDRPLSYCYRRSSVVIYGNVVKATHGETRDEVLGSGDASRPGQRFGLKQSPLTYLAAPTAAGAASTLQVFVNGVRWHERDNFIDAGPSERLFVIRSGVATEVVFGDGSEGGRLPTGTGNLRAIYRSGTGKSGNARAGQISLLGSRPLGVKDVINPLRASGGADAESLDEAREHAPLGVRALDRLVATRDYADFSCTFAGIGKASARELSDGWRSVVHVTIAGSEDVPIDVGSDLYRNLLAALRELGDPLQPVLLASRELLIVVISAKLAVDPDYLWEDVVVAVRQRLLETFGFQGRSLGQSLFASEVVSAIQSVRGVVFVDLDTLAALPTTIDDPAAEGGRRPLTPEELAEEARQIGVAPPTSVRARLACRSSSRIAPAQLAICVPDVPATIVLNPID